MPFSTLSDHFTLFFASQTGNAESIARHIYSCARQLGFKGHIFPANHFQSLALAPNSALFSAVWILIISTTGDGDVPENGIGMYKLLRKLSRQPHSSLGIGLPLSHVRFVMLGLGDSNYSTFCGGAKRIHRGLIQLGANEIVPVTLVDDATPSGMEKEVEAWIHALLGDACASSLSSSSSSSFSSSSRVGILESVVKRAYHPHPVLYSTPVSPRLAHLHPLELKETHITPEPVSRTSTPELLLAPLKLQNPVPATLSPTLVVLSTLPHPHTINTEGIERGRQRRSTSRPCTPTLSSVSSENPSLHTRSASLSKIYLNQVVEKLDLVPTVTNNTSPTPSHNARGEVHGLAIPVAKSWRKVFSAPDALRPKSPSSPLHSPPILASHLSLSDTPCTSLVAETDMAKTFSKSSRDSHASSHLCHELILDEEALPKPLPVEFPDFAVVKQLQGVSKLPSSLSSFRFTRAHPREFLLSLFAAKIQQLFLF